jgi:protein-disulfide isomerase
MKRKMMKAGIGCVVGVLLVAAPVLAQSSDQQVRDQLEDLKAGQEAIQQQIALEAKIDALQKGQEEMRQQLEELKKLLQARPAAAAPQRPAGPNVADVVFDLGDNPVKGDASAPLTLVEFTDIQCPFCARHVRETHPKIEEEFISSGKLRFASLDMPLENLHKQAFLAAQASHCAGDQGKFWEMRDRLFQNQRQIEPLAGHAEALGLNVEQLNGCVDGEKHAEAVRKDLSEARKAGATGTPSFVLAKTNPSDPTKVTGISFIRGAKSFSEFKVEIEAALEDLGG